MQFNDLLKTQMILQLPGTSKPLLNLLTLQGFELAVKTFPVWSTWTGACCRRRAPQPDPRTPKASITFERGVAPATNNSRSAPQNSTLYANRMDAVVHFATTLPAIKSLLSVTHHDYLPNEFEAVCLDMDVYFELQDIKTADGSLEIIKFKLYSYDNDIQHLQAFVDSCSVDYDRRMANKLGAHRYFFDQLVASKAKGNMQNPLPSTHLIYTKSKFKTNRTFDNVFFAQKKQVASRTKFFLENREWYDKKGIPYTLGFMLHGPAGTGKTSTIKAIANDGRRHIINIQLSEIKSKQQLQHLFFNEEVHVYNGANTEKYTIPVSERLYVIEDIDAMGDTVLRREWKKPVIEKAKTGDPFLDAREEKEESLDLSFLLNLLDGTLEANGRILIISTNFPERIDKALIRPGRVDMIVHFDRCTLPVLREMVEAFYEEEVELTDPSLDRKWTPAEVNQILFKNMDDHEAGVRELHTLTQEDLYGFQESKAV